MRHPSEAELALLAGGDLGFWEGWRVRRHISGCPDCAHQRESFQAVREGLTGCGEEPPKDLNWNFLAEEMTGNIRVGLAAGQAIARFDRSFSGIQPRQAGWRVAVIFAGASAVFLTAFWLDLPRQQADRVVSALQHIRIGRIGTVIRGRAPILASTDEVMLEASHSSIQVKENGSAMSLMHPRSDGDGVTISVNMQGSAGARWVDADTGQVTINRVYYARQ